MKKIGYVPVFEVPFKEETAEEVGKKYLQNIIKDSSEVIINATEWFEESELRGTLTPVLSAADAAVILFHIAIEDNGRFILADPERSFQTIYHVNLTRDEEGNEKFTFIPDAQPINWHGAGDFDFECVTFKDEDIPGIETIPGWELNEERSLA